MATPNYLLSNTFVFLAIASFTISCCYSQHEDRKVYIVYMGELPTEDEYTPLSHHETILQDIVEGSSVQDTLVYSYKRSFNGFSAKLTEREVQKLSGMKGIVSVFPNRIFQLQTTRSWDFIGLTEKVKRIPSAESNTIVGVLDTGVWPESTSFSDDGFGPPPKKWKGTCDGGHNFTCNNKLIGARYYVRDVRGGLSARDTQGHGTHTASTAAGSMVKGVSFFKVAKGNARGAVPSARIAAYKVCNTEGCPNDAILAGFDDAIADGVDILSVSLGNTDPVAFDQDPVAIGSFHALKKGILTSNSAGNNGPNPKTVTSNAPWLLTVAASSTDRKVIDKIVLGNGKTIRGIGVNGFKLNGTAFSLRYGDNISTECDPDPAKRCFCLDKGLVKGKIIICDGAIGADTIQDTFTSGALGTIIVSESHINPFDVSFVYPLPASLINVKHGDIVKSYFNSTKNPVATILRSETIKDSEAPVVVSFSSRGPNTVVPHIVKPDISAPGVDILAAFSPMGNPSSVIGDARSVKYNILSGTSMACPHATGAAAYVKTFHPNWSPSAIKSALMTTAFAMNSTKNSDAEFAYGSGQIDPVKATNPGLVYETLADEYVMFLCSVGYDSSKVKLITSKTCPSSTTIPYKPYNFNYPSLGSNMRSGVPFNIDFKRVVTNVGAPNSTYKVKITSDDRLKVTVVPDVLSFKSVNEKKSFVVNVAGDRLNDDDSATGSIVWSDGVHTVRSPIVVYTHSIVPSTPST
ncbi:hypothetical protein MKX01_009320 [Papaver californicum]|nr:hypothetical protein MKX01_009320 [Papaver californicum]